MKMLDDFDERLMYDFTICDRDSRYTPFKALLKGDYMGSFVENCAAFHELVSSLFQYCFLEEQNYKQNPLAVVQFCPFLEALVKSYTESLQPVIERDPKEALECMLMWTSITHHTIDDRYNAYPEVDCFCDPFADDPGPLPRDLETSFLRDKYLQALYQYVFSATLRWAPQMPPQLFDVVPFNMWKDSFDELKKSCENRIGLPSSKRAIVFVEDNKTYFYNYLRDRCVEYCEQKVGEPSGPSNDSIDKDFRTEIEDLVCSLFQSFHERILEETTEEKDVDNALLAWILRLTIEISVYACTSRDYIKAHVVPRTSDVEISDFYYDICEKVVFDMAFHYFEDSESIPLVPPGLSQKKEHNPGVVVDDKLQKQLEEERNAYLQQWMQHSKSSSKEREEFIEYMLIGMDNIPDKPKPSKQSKQTSTIVFSDVLTKEKQEILLGLLTSKINSCAHYYEGYAYLKAAIILGYVRNPTFPEVERTFPRLKGKEQNYSGFMGKRGKFSDELISRDHKALIELIKSEILAKLQ